MGLLDGVLVLLRDAEVDWRELQVDLKNVDVNKHPMLDDYDTIQVSSKY